MPYFRGKERPTRAEDKRHGTWIFSPPMPLGFAFPEGPLDLRMAMLRLANDAEDNTAKIALEDKHAS